MVLGHQYTLITSASDIDDTEDIVPMHSSLDLIEVVGVVKCEQSKMSALLDFICSWLMRQWSKCSGVVKCEQYSVLVDFVP